MTNYERRKAEARGYYALCDEAERLGIPTSLDDPESPATVRELREAIAAQDPVGAERPPGADRSYGEA